ncbi:MAG TPA: transporter substrate-binding domain-containing protein [Hydrogenophaga sp.]
MKRWRSFPRASLLLSAALCTWSAGPALAEPAQEVVPASPAAPLKVCMSEDNAPLSMARKGRLSGFDVAMAEAVARELGRPLRLVPFESELESDANFAIEVNALLSAGVCDLVSGFPLLSTDLGKPVRASAKTPDYPGAKRFPLRPWIPLGTLVASDPYQGMALQLVQRTESPAANTLGDLKNQTIGAVAGTLGGTLVATFNGGALVPHMVSLSQNEDEWAALTSGRVDALLVPTTAWDVARQRVGQAGQLRAGKPLPLGVNLGWVALTEQARLLEAVNRVAAREADLQQWAQAVAMQRLRPTLPAVVESLTLSALLAP